MSAAARLNGVVKRYGEKIALDGVSLAIEPGKVTALLGPNGAGKTSAISLLLGLAAPQSGAVEVLGGTKARELPPGVETALAMIVREAATNIQRHAGATQADIEISTGGDAGRAAAVALRVSDNGRGGIAGRGNGLAGIGERVRSLGGTLEIDSPPGAGTVLRASLPLTP